MKDSPPHGHAERNSLTVIEPLQRIQVGVVVERRKAKSAWIDWVWQPSAVLPAVPDMPAWQQLSTDGEQATFYVGACEIFLYRSETTNYRDNLATGDPRLWIMLRPTGAEPPYEVTCVTADPAEGEALTESGGDLVEAVAMPTIIREAIEAFVAAHHVERSFVKRQRDRDDPEALARRSRADEGSA